MKLVPEMKNFGLIAAPLSSSYVSLLFAAASFSARPSRMRLAHFPIGVLDLIVSVPCSSLSATLLDRLHEVGKFSVFHIIFIVAPVVIHIARILIHLGQHIATRHLNFLEILLGHDRIVIDL